VWLTQQQMSELFGKAKSTINEHIKNIYKEGELLENETMTKFGNSEFSDKISISIKENSNFIRREDERI
jgi:hypothetical protein